MTTTPLFKATNSRIDKADTIGLLEGRYRVLDTRIHWSGSMFTASSTPSSSGYNVRCGISTFPDCIIYSNFGEGPIGIYNSKLNSLHHWMNKALDTNDVVVKLFERMENRIADYDKSETGSSGIRVYASSSASNVPEEDYGKFIPPGSASNEKKLICLIQQEPIEDGYGHPAEQLIEESLKSSPFNPSHWVYNAYLHNTKSHPTIAAAVLRCLSRLPRSLVKPWGVLLAIPGLAHEDVEIRDASVRALERWGGHEAFEALKSRIDTEPRPWLASYIGQVIRDLED